MRNRARSDDARAGFLERYLWCVTIPETRRTSPPEIHHTCSRAQRSASTSMHRGPSAKDKTFHAYDTSVNEHFRRAAVVAATAELSQLVRPTRCACEPPRATRPDGPNYVLFRDANTFGIVCIVGCPSSRQETGEKGKEIGKAAREDRRKSRPCLGAIVPYISHDLDMVREVHEHSERRIERASNTQLCADEASLARDRRL